MNFKMMILLSLVISMGLSSVITLAESNKKLDNQLQNSSLQTKSVKIISTSVSDKNKFSKENKNPAIGKKEVINQVIKDISSLNSFSISTNPPISPNADTTAPIFTSTPNNLTFSEGATGLKKITWKASDEIQEDKYVIYNEGVVIASGSYTSSSTLIADVSGLAVGIYNVTIVVNDTSGNFAVDTAYAIVVDTALPIYIAIPLDTNYTEATESNTVTWTPSDLHPDYYELHRNGSFVTSGLWTDNNDITLNIDGLNPGFYDLILTIYDTTGNFRSDSVILRVDDDPFITSFTYLPGNITLNEGSTGQVITWNSSKLPDIYSPDKFVIWENDIQQSSGFWNNLENITYSLNGLALGIYNYTIVINDTSGYKIQYRSYVIVLDLTNPIISLSPGDISNYIEDSTGNELTWKVTDNNPGTYQITINSVIVESSTWLSGSPITINIDNFAIGTYDFILIATDEFGNPISDTITVTVSDQTIPDIILESGNIGYIESDIGNLLIWTATDKHEGTYDLYRNGTKIGLTFSWTGGNNISIDVDGLSAAVYNFTIQIFDLYGNYNSSTLWVSVFDVIIPLFTNTPTNQSYSEITDLHQVSWTATDNHPANYFIYQNGSLVGFGDWNSGTSITYNVGGRLQGVYNFTFVFNDYGNNKISNTIIIIVSDPLNPVLTQIPIQSIDDDISYALGSIGNTLEWIATDNHPQNYIIYFKTSPIQLGDWFSSAPISINIDGLASGEYNYTMIFYDVSGNFVLDYVHVIVADSPVFIQIPDDIQFLNDSSGNELIWVASDSNYDKYEIYRNEVLILNGSWVNQIAINVTIDGLDIGLYNFTIRINDTDSNISVDTVFVTVTDSPQILSTADDLIYSEGSSGNSIFWEVSDSSPTNYSLFKNGVLLNQSNWSNGIIITEYIDGLLKGSYTYTIYIYDSTNNFIFDTIIVTVIDNDNPKINTIPENIEFEQGELNHTLNWLAYDNYPSNYSIYVNGLIFTNGTWNNTSAITINVDDLPIGNNTILIIIADESGNPDSHSVWVKVNDFTQPIINQPLDLIFNQDSIGNSISWIGSDFNSLNYTLFFGNGTHFLTGNWISGISIDINVDGFKIGNYTLIITIYDINLNNISDSIDISVIDISKTPPVIDGPDNFSYSEGIEGNIISWNVVDDQDVTFTVYIDSIDGKNNIIFESDYQIVISVDNLEIGVHNFTLVVVDVFGNISEDSVFVSVFDTTEPFISSTPNNINYNEGSTGNEAIWFAYDTDFSHYKLLINDSLHATGNWANFLPINVNIDGLERGFHNLTLLVYDASLNYINSTVIIFISDVINPSFSLVPENLEILEGMEVANLEWNVFDSHPANYSIYVNGIQVQTGLWFDVISFPVHTLLARSYNITIIVWDTSLNEASNSVILNVEDATYPTFNEIPIDINFLVNSTGNELIIDVFDNNPDSYIIYQDGEPIGAGSWDNNQLISFNLDALEFGKYNFTLEIYDVTGNLLTTSITVKVTSPLIVETNAPTIIISSKRFESDIETLNSFWKNINDTGISNANVEIVLLDNGEEVENTYQIFQTTSTGEFQLIFDYTGILPGKYQWVITLTRTGFESQEKIIDVEILPHTYEIELLPSPTLVEGEKYFITARITYANDLNNSLLSLNQLNLNQIEPVSGAVKGLELEFEIQVSYQNGVTSQLTLSAISDANGIVSIFLAKGQTENLLSIDSIKASISNSIFGTGPSVFLDQNDLPEVTEGTGSPVNQINDLIAEYTLLGFILLILSIVGLIVYIVINRRRNKKYRTIIESIKFGKSEFEGILSLQACIIMNKGGVPLYEERFEQFNINPTLVAGMSTAISSFFNEFGTSEKIGFETIERSGMSITSHKSEISTIVIISSIKAPNIILEQVQRAQQIVEKKFQNYFSGSNNGNLLEDGKVHEIFEKSEFKVSLLRNLVINHRNLNRINRIRSISRNLKINISLLKKLENSFPDETKSFTIRQIMRFYENQKLNTESIARLILLAYKHGVIIAEK
ncbi:MAG: hypothetical protein HeimC2_08510 [Candidatus Heimdallarchaeota archaeon LC_2]|nr:MAG: hypothetical protein HeimC2_08510 [Candidatus Heimdallarchaeota archaeon LC_2]